MKLEIKHIAPYLPFEVKVIDTEAEDCIWTLHPYKDSLDCLTDNEHLSLENFITENNATKTPVHKLLLRPLSDLTNEIEVDGEKFIPKEKINLIHDLSGNNILNFRTGERIDILCLPYFMVEKLFEWHFDVFGLIDQNLAHPLI